MDSMRSWQGGQALPLMVVFVVVLSGALILLFDAGQMLTARMRLSSASDHVAFSVATEEARLLNLNAYLNRAAIANQLAVAQDISIASWAAFVQPIPQRASVLLVPPVTPVGAVVEQGSAILASAMLPIGEAMGAFVLENQLANRLIRLHQQEMNITYYQYLVKNTPQAVLSDSGMAADGVNVNLLSTTDILPLVLEDHKGSKRNRLETVMKISREPFTTARVRWDKNFGLDKCSRLLPNVPFYELVKRGGTDLLGLDVWKGIDTFSMHAYIGYWRTRDFNLPKWTCRHKEYPVGYGSALVADSKRDPDHQSRVLFDGSWRDNPQGSKLSRTSRVFWDSRNGNYAKSPAVPEFYDISTDRVESGKREMVVAVRLFLKKKNINVTDGGSGMQVGRTVSIYSDLPDDEMSARSRAVVYFQRPVDFYLNQGKIEVANLFNPYWRVRLDALSGSDRLAYPVPL